MISPLVSGLARAVRTAPEKVVPETRRRDRRVEGTRLRRDVWIGVPQRDLSHIGTLNLPDRKPRECPVTSSRFNPTSANRQKCQRRAAVYNFVFGRVVGGRA